LRHGAGVVKEVVQIVPRLSPAIDGLDGFSVLRWAIKNAPLPVVVCSGQSERESVFKALEAGAVDFITKPELRHAIRSEDFAEHLRQRVEAAAKAHACTSLLLDEDKQSHILAARLAQASAERARSCIVAIVGSAGSPAAVGLLLSRLRRDFSVPVVVALHMPQGFTRSFAERLSRTTPFTAREARDGERIQDSQVYVAPGGYHTTITGRTGGELFFQIEPSCEKDFYAPSANRLLESVAESCGEKSLAVILTGMGDDGLRGAQAIKRGGGSVLVESRDSALIWGMPRAVSEAGLADAELTPASIAAAIPLLCSDNRPTK
jgi:two-component system chemotaxis response regulator CheB